MVVWTQNNWIPHTRTPKMGPQCFQELPYIYIERERERERERESESALVLGTYLFLVGPQHHQQGIHSLGHGGKLLLSTSAWEQFGPGSNYGPLTYVSAVLGSPATIVIFVIFVILDEYSQQKSTMIFKNGPDEEHYSE